MLWTLQILYNITRPAQDPETPHTPLIRVAKQKIAAKTSRPRGSMVSYAKERRTL